MNVLILTQFFSQTKGGGEYVFSLIAKMLADNEHKVWVITNKIFGEKYPHHKNLELVFVPPTLEYKGGIPPEFTTNIRYSFNAIIKGQKLIKNKKIDIIHSNNFAPAFAGSILSSLTSTPHITTIHDVFSLCGKDYWKKWGEQNKVSKINSILAPFFEKLLLKLKHDGIHTVSNATKDDLLKFGAKKKIYVIFNSIEEITLDEPTKTVQYQFVFVGRLVFYKNLEVVIKAIKIAKKSEPKIKLIIAGDGPHRKYLENFTKELGIESNVSFEGFVDIKEKEKLIATSNAMVFPSLCEGFGLVILEAFSHKKPVLASNIPPMSDILSDGKNGFLLNPYDENEWSKILIRLIRNPETSKNLGISGNKALQEKFQASNMYEKIIEMYAELIKKRS